MSISTKEKYSNYWDFFALDNGKPVKTSTQVKEVYKEIYCLGDCNMGAPCQTCGSNGQYIGTVSIQRPKVCGMCADFGPQGCTTSVHERRHGHANTPACEEFKPKVGAQ